MLNIPSAVKALFQTDGVHKNFRVHFPNGEMADITNDNVVSESVKFTESLCSQSTFKFGLAEASVLEFETVGVANMYGMTIEASIEIDCSSLSAGDKSAIAAGTWDGTWDGVNSVFAIPLGTFRIESCPRDHQNMAHRQGTGYTVQMTDNTLLSEFDRQRASRYVYSYAQDGKGTVNLWYYLYAQIGCADPAFLATNFTQTVRFDNSNMTEVTGTLQGVQSGYWFKLEYTWLRTTTNHTYENTDIIGVDIADIDLKGALDFINDMVDQYGAEDRYETPGVGKFSDSIAWNYQLNAYRDWDIWYDPDTTMYESVAALYPFYLNRAPREIDIPTYIKLSLMHRESGQDVVVDSFTTQSTVSPKIYQYTPTATLPTVSLTVESTANLQWGKLKCYAFDGAFTPASWFEGLLETNAQFGGMDRLSGIKLLRLNSASPIAIGPSNYEECWWDEYNFEPIGTVTVTYTDSDNKENTADVSIGNGASRYDMTSNDMLNKISSGSLYSVSNLIKTSFKPYARTVEFTPIDMTMQGWPWMEAGDALKITAEDGTVVNTYALRIEMSGIQNLKAVITAQGGEIIGEV